MASLYCPRSVHNHELVPGPRRGLAVAGAPLIRTVDAVRDDSDFPARRNWNSNNRERRSLRHQRTARNLNDCVDAHFRRLSEKLVGSFSKVRGLNAHCRCRGGARQPRIIAPVTYAGRRSDGSRPAGRPRAAGSGRIRGGRTKRWNIDRPEERINLPVENARSVRLDPPVETSRHPSAAASG